MTQRYPYDDAATWSANPDAGTDELAEDGPIVLWCSACQGWRWCSWLCPGAAENDGDEDWARVCESCASWCFEYDGPEPYVQRAQCNECKVGTLVTQPDAVPESVGTVWSCDTCHLVRLVPHITPVGGGQAPALGAGAGPPDQWMTGRPASKEAS
jgi:hypothetical protein